MGAPYDWPRELGPEHPALFDGTPQGIADQLKRVLMFLQLQPLRPRAGHLTNRRAEINAAYNKVYGELVALCSGA